MRSTSRTLVFLATARRMLSVGIAVVLASLLVVMAGPSTSFAAHGGKPHRPVELWKAFPLGRKAHPPATAASTPGTRVPPHRLHTPPAPAAPRPSRPASGHETWLSNLTYLLFAGVGVAAAALVFVLRRSTGGRRPARNPTPGGELLIDAGEQTSPNMPDSPAGDSVKLRVLARLRDAGVLDDDQFAAKQAEALEAEAQQTAALQALVELHETGLLDDEQFAEKTAQIFHGRRRGRSEEPSSRRSHLAVGRSRESDPP
jgi:hypothetical protein